MKFKTMEPILVLSVQLFIRLTNCYLCLLCTCAQLLSHVRLFAALWTSLWSFSVHGIFQARTLEWVAISYSRGSSWSKDQTCVSCVFYTGRQILYLCATWEDLCATYKKTCTINVHITLIQNTTKLRTTQMSINRWVDTQIVIFT